MRYGLREICDVVFRPLATTKIGGQTFKAGQPCLWMESAKTSTLEGAATTVYAQGGQGNPRLIGWDGEKTLTFTIEDALLTDVSLSMLTGADLAQVTGPNKTYVHATMDKIVGSDGKVTFDTDPGIVFEARTKNTMPIYGVVLDSAGAVSEYIPDALVYTKPASGNSYIMVGTDYAGKTIKIDCYVIKEEGKILTITPDKFAGYYYIEASTLFRDEATGQDFPAEFVIPRGKIQSNFTFSMSASGDPSTFTFVVDAFPAYTKFDMMDEDGNLKKVLAAIQILDGEVEEEGDDPHYVIDSFAPKTTCVVTSYPHTMATADICPITVTYLDGTSTVVTTAGDVPSGCSITWSPTSVTTAGEAVEVTWTETADGPAGVVCSAKASVTVVSSATSRA